MQTALQHVEQACRFGPTNADHWDMRARVLLRLGRDLHQAATRRCGRSSSHRR